MSTPYEQGGYVNLKRRTREALVTAAREIVADGRTPKVEDAAASAGVSRTTAYRYFPNQAALLVAAHPEVGTESMLDADAPTDPRVRIDVVVDRVIEMIQSTELQQRTMLRLSLDPNPERRAELPLRQGRVIPWLVEALDPLRAEIGDDGVRRVAVAIRSAIGIEALVWLVDVAGQTRAEAADTMRWSARAMLTSALEGRAPGK
ncbi:transcriptional regulator [Janibacter sp. HTCC2649]|uniref:TetR/AcrR family transcriptional regulator n=1 Tax=Janibacter sp. HTCC2649 TaxID=313589 RepID=UPI0000670AE0|nr:TetR/AcrR family transcriptional regulator [Janibacter sp. HTCC2649]EAQ00639.1 transcriptional regulator [Janibacter sp. HTCC2649]